MPHDREPAKGGNSVGFVWLERGLEEISGVP